MIRQLLSLLRSDRPIVDMKSDLIEMMRRSSEMTRLAGSYYFDRIPEDDVRELMQQRDIGLNQLQRLLRKKIISHLTLSDSRPDAQHGLLFMSLAKDVERIGDYCKNLVEIQDFWGGELPEDEVGRRLREIRSVVEGLFEPATDAFEHWDAEAALMLLRRGREARGDCQALFALIAHGTYDAATTTALVLGSRYYKRIASHLCNVLTAVVMPLHKLDYFDEDSLGQT